jgi:protocatechuate 3,4-dioxygenase beta subunit
MFRSLILVTGLAAAHPETSALGKLKSAPAPVQVSNTKAEREQRTLAPAIPEKSAAPGPEQSLPNTYTHPINVQGRAFDPAGKPVVGARVYLASRCADYRRVAQTTTDADGRYEFHDVPLPMERAKTVTARDQGVFQVFGEAEGLGFAWRPQKWFYPQPKPANITDEPEPRDPPSRFEANDRIVLDLNFPPAARLTGMIVDDRGIPLPDVRLEIRLCESLSIVDGVVGGWTLDALNERDSAPPSMKIRMTDAKGRFEFTGLPVDCRFRINVQARSYPDRWVYAATTREPQLDYDGSPVATGDIKLTLSRPRNVPVRVVFGDTGAPAPAVGVAASDGLVSTLQTTDSNGLATLTLPAGKYRMECLPARGTPYLVTTAELVPGPEVVPAKPVVASLRAAAIIDVTVVDADTGAAIPEVDIWQENGGDGGREPVKFRSWEVATRTAWVETPRTNTLGRLRAFVEPGKHRIGVGLESYPTSHQVVESGGQEVECRPHETVQLKFTMRKRS